MKMTAATGSWATVWAAFTARRRLLNAASHGHKYINDAIIQAPSIAVPTVQRRGSKKDLYRVADSGYSYQNFSEPPIHGGV
jgi:hypothetical protein